MFKVLIQLYFFFFVLIFCKETLQNLNIYLIQLCSKSFTFKISLKS